MVSATYQWGGVARLDIVSAPPGTALAFYGPPALHVHALPLVAQEELVQSAAALAAQCDSAQRDTAQHDIAQHSTAQSTSAQRDASGASELATHPLDDHGMIQDEPSVNDVMQDWHQPLPATLQSSSAVLTAGQHHANDQVAKPPSQQQPRQLQQQQHVYSQQHDDPGRHEMASSDAFVSLVHEGSVHEPVRQAVEEEGEAEEGLFGEVSVLARGGLRMTDKVTCIPNIGTPVLMTATLVHAGCMQTQKLVALLMTRAMYGLGHMKLRLISNLSSLFSRVPRFVCHVCNEPFSYCIQNSILVLDAIQPCTSC